MASNSITRKYPKLRESAKGEQCCLQIHPYCNGDDSTTILAHVSTRLSSGMGMKAPDWYAVYSCSSCHDAIDGRTKISEHFNIDIQECLLDGLFRTWKRFVEKGLINV